MEHLEQNIALAVAANNSAISTEIGASTNKWMPELSDADYHSVKTRLGSSGLATLFLETPQDFKFNQDNPQADDTESLHIGDLVHKLIFYPGLRGHIAIAPKGDKRTKAVKEAYDAFEKTLHDESIVLQDSEATLVLGMMKSILEHKKASQLLSGGTPERAGFFEYEHQYTNPVTGVVKMVLIQGKFKPDFMRDDGIMCDLKTVRAGHISPRGFFSSIREYAYLIQAAWYSIGYQKVTGKPLRAFVFIPVQKKPPFLTAVYMVNEAQMELGRSQLTYALNRYCLAVETGVWPGYPDIMDLEVPDYYFKDAI